MRKIIIYPFLFSINPVLLLYSANVSDIPVGEVFLSLAIVPLLCVLLYLLLVSLFNNAERAGFLTLLVEFWFFHYGTIYQMVPSLRSGTTIINTHWYLLPVWSMFFILLGSTKIWKQVRNPKTITNYLNILSIVLILFTAGRVLLDLVPRYTRRPINANLIDALPEHLTQPVPDIYFIILDGYARQDVLTNLYQFDNQPFLLELEQRGFQIASQSKSNYMQTGLSVASTLNMDYLSDINPGLPDRGQLIGRINHSQVRAILEKYGYTSIALSSGYLPTEIIDADHYLTVSPGNLNFDFEALLAVNTIARPFFDNGWLHLPISEFRVSQERIQFTIQMLKSLSDISDPKFVFAHILIPHPPFIFSEDGPITPEELYILGDGERLGLSSDAYRKGYTAQLLYTNRIILETIDAIITNSTQPPIIILQSDHGPGLYLHTGSAVDTCHFERFSILSAIYAPNSQNIMIPQDIASVNIFRFIFNAYFEADFELLPDYQYYSTWEKPYQFIDVSELTNEPCITSR